MCKMIHHMLLNYQHVFIAFAIIKGVALQEYNEYNNLPYGILETIQCYNKCFKHPVFPFTQFYHLPCS
jgi:hypothetical protein